MEDINTYRDEWRARHDEHEALIKRYFPSRLRPAANQEKITTQVLAEIEAARKAEDTAWQTFADAVEAGNKARS
jgi:hypothetical protein